jgi:hypothetical protein
MKLLCELLPEVVRMLTEDCCALRRYTAIAAANVLEDPAVAHNAAAAAAEGSATDLAAALLRAGTTAAADSSGSEVGCVRECLRGLLNLAHTELGLEVVRAAAEQSEGAGLQLLRTVAESADITGKQRAQELLALLQEQQ